MDGDHPAELYAGTYTGLCYSCQNADMIKLEDLPGGFERWSFPPQCPGWRRDREEFIGKRGCPECGGMGRNIVSRHDREGGNYSRSCDCIRGYRENKGSECTS